MPLSTALRDTTFRWLADDIDPADQAELQGVLAAAMTGQQDAIDELTDRMSGPLTFGTAGLRGPVRAGPNGMNRAVVTRTSAGVAQWLLAHGHGGGIVVVGRDARHGSEAFHADAAGVFAASGFDVRVLSTPLPTPVLAFAVRQLGAVAGVQITASHNPPADNGYKLYDGTGGQIVPPTDREVEAAIRGIPGAVQVQRANTWRGIGEELLEAYFDRVATVPRGSNRQLRIALTPMHGVGGATAVEALRRAGFTDVRVVRAQAAPDPDFPSVPFPNPEEPGATDQLLALTEESGADLAIALDPDADRCALGVRDTDGWRMLRGDETGSLLGNHVLSTLDRAANPDPLVATTIVSSSLLGSIADSYGARYAETLTGFKWLVRAGDGRATGLVFAYEEALGLCVDPNSVRDKDGISASVLAADLAASTKAAGGTLLGLLDQLAVDNGLHLTEQISVRVSDLSRIGALMAKLRANPPAELAGAPAASEDLLPTADVFRLRGEGLRVIIRPSGTEPKIKAYLEIVEPVADAGALADARRRAGARLSELHNEVASLLAD
ncbi:MAG TPA: phospho-sugar mutase [Pseudonocardiaceae bacterium]|jgi:phosphomannomutase|nr:phospho-sugar mutase [Pseudonocardiaceae bacterium]